MSDRVFIRGLGAETLIGLYEWERHVRQKVVFDLELPVDCARAARSDAVSDSVDYARLAQRVIEFAAQADCKLVETLAERVAQLLLREFDLDWVRLSLHKPGALREAREVGVAIERRREVLQPATLAPPSTAST